MPFVGDNSAPKEILLSVGAGGAEEVCKVGVAFLGGDVEGGFSLGVGGINIYAGYGGAGGARSLCCRAWWRLTGVSCRICWLYWG